jgi:hypothetical protein
MRYRGQCVAPDYGDYVVKRVLFSLEKIPFSTVRRTAKQIQILQGWLKMQALDYLLPQPNFELTPGKQAAFDALLDSTPPGGLVDYQIACPKWQFLSYICKARELVLHGSQNAGIEIVEPRQALDVRAFSAQEAIYATTDGLWVIYFAIIDRKGFAPLSLFNSCLDVHISPEQVLGPLYFFSITHSALVQNPWCTGAIYILPRENFEREPAQHMLGAEIVFPHWISAKPARPVAKLLVEPQDFPFLAQIHGHDDEKLSQLAAADPHGFPWPGAWEA